VYGDSYYYFFSVAVLASALSGGVGPGLLATCLAGLASAYFFIYPFCSIRVESPEAGQHLAMFVVKERSSPRSVM
jgi:K+-sensing histidine kinase KdpD